MRPDDSGRTKDEEVVKDGIVEVDPFEIGLIRIGYARLGVH